MFNKHEADEFCRSIRSCFPGRKQLALHEPHFNGREKEFVLDCIESGWVSSVGSYVDQFERQLAEYTGVGHAVAVVNGTAALHVCLMLAGVQADDEVLCPALTFIATANAISYCNAIPHFVDSEERTLGLDPGKLGDYLKTVAVRDGDCFRNKYSGRVLRAVVPVHIFGHPVDLDPLQDVCERYRIRLVEDAAESLGSTYRGRHAGTFGIANAISFNGNKIITTGGGGAVLTNDAELAQRAKHLVTTGKRPHAWRYEHDVIAHNYRLPNVNAALGCGQLAQLPQLLIWKRQIATAYGRAFAGFSGASVVVEPSFAKSNYWLNAVRLEGGREQRDEVIEIAREKAIAVRPVWDLLDTMPMYRDCPAMDLSVGRLLEEQLISLPSSPGLALAIPESLQAA